MLIFATRCSLELYAATGCSTRRGVFSGFQRISFGAGMYTFHDVPIDKTALVPLLYICVTLVGHMLGL